MKMIEEINKEKKELKEKLNVLEKEKKELETKMNNVNNQLSHAVNVKKKPEKLKIYEKVKNTEFKVENEETEKNNFDKEGFDEGGLHKDTGTKYNFEGFDIHKDTKNKYDPNGFDKEGLHKDTNTFLNKEKNIRKDILENINWLNDKDEFLKLYNKIIKNGEFRVNTEKNEHISSYLFKEFLEDILSGKIKYNNVGDYEKDINDIEKDLNNLTKSKKIDKLKYYIKKINYLLYGKDKEKIKTDQAKPFEHQKGKGYVNLPIALSKIYTNNSSKELINNIKQLINDLYDNEQITKQVYNNLIKAITYK